jgi:hypothetical protein
MFLIAIFFAMLSPFIPPLIVGILLLLLVRFGLLFLLLEWLGLPADQKVQITRYVSRIISGIIIIYILLPFFLCAPGEFVFWLQDLGEATIGGWKFDMIWSFLFSPTWLVLIVGAWLTLLYYFGFLYLLGRFGVPLNQRQYISSFAMTIMVFVGLLTGLLGFRQWIHMATENPLRFEEAQDFGFIELSSTTGLLTIGLLVMLYISLEKSLAMEENIERYEHIAKNMAIALLLALVILGVLGGAISIGIHFDRKTAFPSIT